MSGNFLVSSLLDFYLKDDATAKVILMGVEYNFAHYSNIAKKMGISLDILIKND